MKKTHERIFEYIAKNDLEHEYKVKGFVSDIFLLVPTSGKTDNQLLRDLLKMNYKRSEFFFNTNNRYVFDCVSTIIREMHNRLIEVQSFIYKENWNDFR